jgi:hypothetical protein
LSELSMELIHKASICEMKCLLLDLITYLHDDNYCERSEAIEEALKLLDIMDNYENLNI